MKKLEQTATLFILAVVVVYPFIQLISIRIKPSLPIIQAQNVSINFDIESDIDSNIEFVDDRSFFKSNFPPLLISFPASGNTFTRLLLEYVTLYWTGSVYRSPLIEAGFKGEINIDNKVIVIKCHPLGFHKYIQNIIDMNNFNNI